MAWKLKNKYANKTLIPFVTRRGTGVALNLTGKDYTHKVEATTKEAASEREYKGITQKQIEAYVAKFPAQRFFYNETLEDDPVALAGLPVKEAKAIKAAQETGNVNP